MFIPRTKSIKLTLKGSMCWIHDNMTFKSLKSTHQAFMKQLFFFNSEKVGKKVSAMCVYPLTEYVMYSKREKERGIGSEKNEGKTFLHTPQNYWLAERKKKSLTAIFLTYDYIKLEVLHEYFLTTFTGFFFTKFFLFTSTLDGNESQIWKFHILTRSFFHCRSTPYPKRKILIQWKFIHLRLNGFRKWPALHRCLIFHVFNLFLECFTIHIC